MIIPNFANFRGGQTILVHSAKGSTWENHKYIKRVDGTYYYPNDYKGGRHISTLNGSGDSGDTKVFDELESHAKRLMKEGKAYWDDDYSDLSRKDNVLNYSREDLADLYEDLTGVKLGEKDMDRLYQSMQAKRKQIEGRKGDTKIFDQLAEHGKRLQEQGEAYWEDDYDDLSRKDNVLNYSREDLADLYEDLTGVKLGKEDAERLYQSAQAKRRQVEEKLGGGKQQDQSEEIEDWERTLYDDIEKTLENNPGLFDPADIVDLQDFELTLAEFAGVDTEGMDPAEIERMRQKVIDHYADEQAARTLNDDDIYNLANEVIKGNFGNGAQRRELLGSNFQEVQDKVNEILRSQGSKPISSEKEEPEQKKEETKKPATSSSTAKKGLNMEQVMDVYRRNQKTAKEDEDKKNRRTSVRNRTRR